MPALTPDVNIPSNTFNRNSDERLSNESKDLVPITHNEHTEKSLSKAECRNTNRRIIEINKRSYTIMEKIGSGGSSKVYRALDENNKIRAIKEVNLSNVSEKEAEGFRNEIDVLNKLKGNERIIELYECEERYALV